MIVNPINGPYYHIQDAVDACKEGETILIDSGIY